MTLKLMIHQLSVCMQENFRQKSIESNSINSIVTADFYSNANMATAKHFYWVIYFLEEEGVLYQQQSQHSVIILICQIITLFNDKRSFSEILKANAFTDCTRRLILDDKALICFASEKQNVCPHQLANKSILYQLS